jgi:hypothetical protein
LVVRIWGNFKPFSPGIRRGFEQVFKVVNHQILRYVWSPPSFMRGRKNELAALAAFILTVDRIEGWNKL